MTLADGFDRSSPILGQFGQVLLDGRGFAVHGRDLIFVRSGPLHSIRST